MGNIGPAEHPSSGASGGAWFISHAGADRAWAEWVGWQLLDAGHQVELDNWDWGAGDNFVEKMSAALERGRLLALLSSAYFERGRFTTPEWTAMVAMREKITPVRLAEVEVPAILRPLLTRDLFGLSPDEARRVLLEAVNGPRRPDSEPIFPGRTIAEGPRLPGALPRVWNLPARNASFTGRDALLVRLRQDLAENGRVAVQALYGRGGVGKTQLAIEYAYRFAGEYELAWWIPSEDPALIPVQLAALAARTGAAPGGTPPQEAVELLLGQLRTRARWLLVFDNAEDPEVLPDVLPGGTGHVLITSRNPQWQAWASPLSVDVFTRAESCALLRTHHTSLEEADADDLAQRLDDLPLALAQANSLLTWGLSPADLKSELAANTAAVLAAGRPAGYQASLAAQLRLTTARLAAEHPGALALLSALALLAPEPFPVTACVDHLPDSTAVPLVDVMASRLTAGQALEAIRRHSLARVQDGTVQMHRLTQMVLTDAFTSEEMWRAGRQAEGLLTAAQPGNVQEPSTWSGWQVLLPHLLAVDPAMIITDAGRGVVRDACWYLMDRGHPHAARNRLAELYETWSRRLGSDHECVLWTATFLARACGDTEDHERARTIDADTLERRRRLLGEDHPDTLTTSANLAGRLAALGRLKEARALGEDTLSRRQQVLGEDHPDTLATRSQLAYWQREAGDLTGAVAAFDALLIDRLRVLGPDHPDTLATRNELAYSRGEAGDAAGAEAAFAELLTDRLRILGPDHPHTLTTRSELAYSRADTGDLAGAVAAFTDLLADRLRILGPDHSDTLATRSRLAYWRGEAGDAAGAVAAFTELLTDRLRLLGPDHPRTLNTRSQLARWQGEAGDAAGAATAFAELLTDRLRILGPDHPHTLNSRHNLAHWQGEMGNAHAAATAFAELLIDQQRVLGPDHPGTCETRVQLTYWLEQSVDAAQSRDQPRPRPLGDSPPNPFRRTR
ncbi:FxSxx-COOH system tetratricopeptide repeat protein [Streptomyces sp. NPDC058642]|uniref:FxSxx-COOH system tetratricopeptide repeat protein n=1 Tax=Streptomyces sp. NPDC058642 TaxID=3346572 RepID=UPI00364DB041